MRAASVGTQHILAEIAEEGIRGTISVVPDVLADIVELASAGIDGLVGFVAPQRGRSIALMLRESERDAGEGNWFARKGIRVRLEDSVVDVDLTVVLWRGVNVPNLADELKVRISEAIDRMLGLQTGMIAVHVRAISDPDSPESE